MPLNVNFEISSHVISTEVPLEETLLMNTRTLGYFGLDPLGTRFWRAMQDSDDADEVLQQVAKATGKTIEQLEPPLQSILAGMERARLLKLRKRPA